jgi:shikimate kinase
MKIYLIGMPGSGKSTLGRKAANELMLQFVDLDHEIEKREQKSIPEIFNLKGEDQFRLTESALLHEWAGSDKSFIMSTGGGTPCFYNGIEVINQTGLSIFLDVSVNHLLKRLEKKTDRPLLQEKDKNALKTKLDTLRQSRLPFYQQARIVIQNPTLPLLLEKIHFKK